MSYLQNLILALIGEDDLAENLQPSGNDDSLTLSDLLCAVAKSNGQFDEIDKICGYHLWQYIFCSLVMIIYEGKLSKYWIVL